MIEHEGGTVVIDAGPDFRQQMLRVEATRLDAVVITHGHKDHIGGMDDLRAFNYLNRAPMTVWSAEEVQTDIRRDFFYAFSDAKYPGVPDMNLMTIHGEPFVAGGLTFIPIPVMHHLLPVFGFRVGKMAYITDCNFIPESSFSLLEGVEVFIVNALRIKPHVSHFGLDQALEAIARVAPREAWLTHISHGLGVHADVALTLPNGVQLAWDGLTLDVSQE
ncbi:MAG: MBL fold metallo-hydrolase [Bacteroidetes bacterium HGW-Bacteroidetes-22]|nr:MAG: MBL fold metallo-hydrolase [Bacteroidetes bacterium HGW-Bacteroidetes-22]